MLTGTRVDISIKYEYLYSLRKDINLYSMYYLLRPADIVADTSGGTLLQI